ncbi:MAG TPA: hypothetical protein DCY13_11015 [Verrucomicrobiales bacterium]|nr:hypothetical protein [Verrucomicrobiales bacterium]
MWNRLLTAIFGLFWLVMLGLLCWSEFGGQRHLGSAASLETVWEKILTSPDASPMEIRMDGEGIGWCTWTPTILEAGPVSTGSADARNLEGMIRQVKGYNLTIKGAFSFLDDTNRYQIKADINFSDLNQWSDFALGFNDREQKIHLSSSIESRELALHMDGPMQIDTRFGFDQLQNPAQLAGQLGGPLTALAFANFPFLPRGTNGAPLMGNLKWTAEYDWIEIQKQRVRCYRLSTRILDRQEISVFVSRVGEILRIELPGGFQLVNDSRMRM